MRKLISRLALRGRRSARPALRRTLNRAALPALALLLASLAQFTSAVAQNANADESARPAAAASVAERATVARTTDPAAIMRSAKLIYVRPKSVFFDAPELENELRKRPEFQRWGLAITRNELDADLIIEVGRKVFTRFVYTVIDPRTNIVVTSGKLSSLGGTLTTKIAKRFIAQMKKARES